MRGRNFKRITRYQATTIGNYIDRGQIVINTKLFIDICFVERRNFEVVLQIHCCDVM